MTSTMQLEFAQAMSDFKTMFPDMDRDVIEAVLRANQGAVDATIDQLLAMSTDNQNEKLRNELDVPDKCATPDLLLTKMLEKPLEEKQTSLLSSSPIAGMINTGTSPKVKKVTGMGNVATGNLVQTENVKLQRKWDPPLLGPLPPTFLRISLPEGIAEPRNYAQGELPDDQFAMMLQNEEFMHELRWNQEFMSSLEKEHGKDRSEDEADFKERLRYMGKKSRKKFMQLARVFTWQRHKKTSSTKQDPPRDSLLLQEDYDEDDIDHPKQQQVMQFSSNKK